MTIITVALMYILALIIMATWKKLTSLREILLYIILSNAAIQTVELIYKSDWFIQISTRM